MDRIDIHNIPSSQLRDARLLVKKRNEMLRQRKGGQPVQRYTVPALLKYLLAVHIAEEKARHPELFEEKEPDADLFLGLDEKAILAAIDNGDQCLTDIRKHPAVKALNFDPLPLLTQMVRHGILIEVKQGRVDVEQFNEWKQRPGKNTGGFAKTLYQRKVS